jgi:hypothetical protein
VDRNIGVPTWPGFVDAISRKFAPATTATVVTAAASTSLYNRNIFLGVHANISSDGLSSTIITSDVDASPTAASGSICPASTN